MNYEHPSLTDALRREQDAVRIPVKYLPNQPNPFPLYMDREAMLAAGINEGDIVTLSEDGGKPTRDWRTGIPVPTDQRFKIVAKEPNAE